MNQESLDAAYQVALENAYAIGILQTIRSKTASHPSVAQLIKEYVPQLVVKTCQLALIKETTDVFQNATQLYSDVVWCGVRKGHSYIDLALRFGETSTMAFAVHSHGLAVARLSSDFSDLDASGVVAAWDKPEQWFSFLDEFGIDLPVCLENECARLTKLAKPDGDFKTLKEIADLCGRSKRWLRDRQQSLGPPDKEGRGRAPHKWLSTNPQVTEFVKEHGPLSVQPASG